MTKQELIDHLLKSGDLSEQVELYMCIENHYDKLIGGLFAARADADRFCAQNPRADGSGRSCFRIEEITLH